MKDSTDVDQNEFKYFNREISLIDFCQRVVEEAEDKNTPILEKLRFLSICSANLDEFFMVRVAGLRAMQKEGIRLTESPEQMPVSEALILVRERTKKLYKRQYEAFHNELLPKLNAEGISLAKISDLSESQFIEVDEYFHEQVFPVLTPLSFDAAHPFPFLANLSMYLVAVPKGIDSEEIVLDRIRFVGVPKVLPRMVPLQTKKKDKFRFILLEDLIEAFLGELFFTDTEMDVFAIRVTRNLDYNLLENQVTDLLKAMQKEVISREYQEVVRIEYDEKMPKDLIEHISEELLVNKESAYAVPWPVDIGGLTGMYKLPLPHLKFRPFNPRLPASFTTKDDIFSIIRKKDLMVHLPFESFYAVTEFMSSAAHDPNVLAIKQTLYRTAGDSPITEALIIAAENGKQVTAIVELKARFDEKNNITWARKLERAGINVVFGFIGMKTHAKMTLVVRKEKNKLVSYAHLSSGNYNSNTAKYYTDVGLFTAHPKITNEVSALFNMVTGFNMNTDLHQMRNHQLLPSLEHISVAPLNIRETFLRYIAREIECAKKHGSGNIIFKCNAIIDKEIIDALYTASQAGVKIKLIVRGICCLRPNVPGLSENIEVISILDRFLEHSRVYYFQGAGEETVLVGSCDLMPRNLDRRVELLLPILDEDIKIRVIQEFLYLYWDDNTKARELQSNGDYVFRVRKPGEIPNRAQEMLINIVREAGIKSIPYDKAIRHNASRQKGRPMAKSKK